MLDTQLRAIKRLWEKDCAPKASHQPQQQQNAPSEKEKAEEDLRREKCAYYEKRIKQSESNLVHLHEVLKDAQELLLLKDAQPQGIKRKDLLPEREHRNLPQGKRLKGVQRSDELSGGESDMDLS